MLVVGNLEMCKRKRGKLVKKRGGKEKEDKESCVEPGWGLVHVLLSQTPHTLRVFFGGGV